MTTAKKIILIASFSAIYGAQAFNIVRLFTPDGIRLNHPIVNGAVPRESAASGDAWMKSGISRIEVRVTDPAGATIVVPAAQDTVKHRGKPIFPISYWRARLAFPSDGSYSVTAAVFGKDGRAVETSPRIVRVSATAKSLAFLFGSTEHITAIAFIVAISILLPLVVWQWRKRSGSTRLRDGVAVALSVVLLVDEIAWHLYWYAMQSWTLVNNMAIHMCSFALVLIPVMFFTENQKTRQYLFEILYFWGLGGAMQALFAPDIGLFGFPLFKYFAYFISHGTIVIAMVYAAVLYRFDMTWKSWVRVAVVTNIATIAAWGFNNLLRFIPPYDVGNYFAIGYPPPNGSVIDVFSDIFGPSPYYLIGLELMGVVLFGLLYLPYPIRRLIRKRARPSGPS